MDEQKALEIAVEAGCGSQCQKSQRGVVIWSRNSGLVAVGANHPPTSFCCDGSESCRASCNKVCVHAEESAILAMIGKRVDPSEHLEMIHVKVVKGEATPSGPPSCWQCSRKILDSGIKTMWLLHEEGLCSYTAEEFHRLTLEHCDLPSPRGRDFSWLAELYALIRNNNSEAASDLLYDKIDEMLLSGDFEGCDRLLRKIQLEKFDTFLLVALASILKTPNKELSEYRGTLAKIRSHLKRLAPDRVETLLKGLVHL